ncbi:hypothetical protein [Adhaeribacter arboris]|nr:hypothetical protein [Adhaeribacter arboris]
MATTTNAPDGKATTIKNTFSRETSVSLEMKAVPAVIWALLTLALTGSL